MPVIPNTLIMQACKSRTMLCFQWDIKINQLPNGFKPYAWLPVLKAKQKHLIRKLMLILISFYQMKCSAVWLQWKTILELTTEFSQCISNHRQHISFEPLCCVQVWQCTNVLCACGHAPVCLMQTFISIIIYNCVVLNLYS